MRIARPIFRTVSGTVAVLIGLTAVAGGPQTSPIAVAAPQPRADAAAFDTALLLPATGNAPAAAIPRSETLGAAVPTGNPEVVVERYPDGSTKLERQVIQDSAGNYVNHGTYTMYSPEGEVIRSGEFRDGKQQGKWMQRIAKDQDHFFSRAEDKEFVGPLLSEATFVDGVLQGTWSIRDRDGQKLVEWDFDRGIREGTSTWWYPGGQKRLEAQYSNGELDGEVLEWARDGQQASRETYVDGRRAVTIIEWYAPGQKHYQGTLLRMSSMAEPAYDWWSSSAKIAALGKVPADQKHGVWVSFYRNGNKQTEGNYDHDQSNGKFTWWYENGQKQAEGEYQAGIRAGTWITWHPNGLKSSQGEYRNGNLMGKFTRWNADGRLAEIHDLNTARAQEAAAPRPAVTSPRPTTGGPQHPAMGQRPAASHR